LRKLVRQIAIDASDTRFTGANISQLGKSRLLPDTVTDALSLSGVAVKLGAGLDPWAGERPNCLR